jgi:phosphatidate cytidylyltransferase
VTLCGYASPDPPVFWMPAVIVGAALCAGFGQAGVGLLVVLAGTAAASFPGGRSGLNFAFGFPYLGLAAVALPWLRAGPDAGLANTLFVLAIVWASDIGAYLTGRLAGGPKLAPSLSPGKTWSGAAGGLAGAVLAALAVAACFSSGFSPSHVGGVAIVLGTISQAGDLLESALKRRFGVKDSGRIIPGHGGLLDRLDALLAVAPAAALLALFVGRGVVLWR